MLPSTLLPYLVYFLAFSIAWSIAKYLQIDGQRRAVAALHPPARPYPLMPPHMLAAQEN